MKRFLFAAAAATAVCAAPADAAVKYKRFHSPSGQISCYAVKYGKNVVECSATYLPEIGEFDPYYGLEPRGKAVHSERSDYPGYENAEQRTLRYGDTYRRKGVRCKMRPSGLRCTNRDGHGFHMAKGNTYRF